MPVSSVPCIQVHRWPNRPHFCRCACGGSSIAAHQVGRTCRFLAFFSDTASAWSSTSLSDQFERSSARLVWRASNHHGAQTRLLSGSVRRQTRWTGYPCVTRHPPGACKQGANISMPARVWTSFAPNSPWISPAIRR